MSMVVYIWSLGSLSKTASKRSQTGHAAVEAGRKYLSKYPDGYHSKETDFKDPPDKEPISITGLDTEICEQAISDVMKKGVDYSLITGNCGTEVRQVLYTAWSKQFLRTPGRMASKYIKAQFVNFFNVLSLPNDLKELMAQVQSGTLTLPEEVEILANMVKRLTS